MCMLQSQCVLPSHRHKSIEDNCPWTGTSKLWATINPFSYKLFEICPAWKKWWPYLSNLYPGFRNSLKIKWWWWQSKDPFCFHADMKSCRHMSTMYWLNKTLLLCQETHAHWCNSGMTVSGVTSCFLIRFQAYSTSRRELFLVIVPVVKSDVVGVWEALGSHLPP